jgi:hypothetical protein
VEDDVAQADTGRGRRIRHTHGVLAVVAISDVGRDADDVDLDLVVDVCGRRGCDFGQGDAHRELLVWSCWVDRSNITGER